MGNKRIGNTKKVCEYRGDLNIASHLIKLDQTHTEDTNLTKHEDWHFQREGSGWKGGGRNKLACDGNYVNHCGRNCNLLRLVLDYINQLHAGPHTPCIVPAI